MIDKQVQENLDGLREKLNHHIDMFRTAPDVAPVTDTLEVLGDFKNTMTRLENLLFADEVSVGVVMLHAVAISVGIDKVVEVLQSYAEQLDENQHIS